MREPSATVEPEPAPRPSRRTILARWLAGGLLVVLMFRLAVADRWPVASMAFYAAPWPLITLGWCVTAILFPRRSQSRRVALLMTLVCLVTTVGSQWVWNRPPAEDDEPSLEILYWNVARGQRGWNNLFDELRQSNADIIALCETDSPLLTAEDWQATFADRYVYRQPRGLLWISRRPAEVRTLEWAPGMIAGSELITQYDGRPMRLLLLDLAGAPYLSRRPGWTQVARFLEQRKDEPTVLVGDLNTPDDSVWTKLCRPFARPVFRSHGRGYAPTWPVPCPVMALDQAWATASVDVRLCQLGWSTLSDHRSIHLRVRHQAAEAFAPHD